jgi:hypothetical protein
VANSPTIFRAATKSRGKLGDFVQPTLLHPTLPGSHFLTGQSFFEIDYYYILFFSLAMMTFAMAILLLVKLGKG